MTQWIKLNCMTMIALDGKNQLHRSIWRTVNFGSLKTESRRSLADQLSQVFGMKIQFSTNTIPCGSDLAREEARPDITSLGIDS